MIYLVWGLFGLVFTFLFVCMLRNMFFTMLDKRAEEEYDRALDEGTRPVVFNAVADRYEYQELPEKTPVWFEDQYDDRARRLLLDQGYSPASAEEKIEKARLEAAIRQQGEQLGNDLRRQGLLEGTNYGVRRPFFGASASGPHVAMFVGDGIILSHGNYPEESFAPRQIEDAMERFNTIKDQI